MNSNAFVFVVCGDNEHIYTLNYSLNALRKYSKKEIFVLTDLSRNMSIINHSNIIDVKTPENLNNHQASIYLKTSIHKFVPPSYTFCYLDSDVIALNENVDSIFLEYRSPITFAQDHSDMRYFSPSALNCGCSEKFAAWQKELKQLFVKYKHLERELENTIKKKILVQRLNEIKKNKICYAYVTIKYWFSLYHFNLDNDFFLDKKNKIWRDKNGDVVLYLNEDNKVISEIEKTTQYRCSVKNNYTWKINNQEVFNAKCNHLAEAIKNTFDIIINDTKWQHWNGGVFLFNHQSHEFLDTWHQYTIQIFKDPFWKIRDQGTLMATVWKYKLENHQVLDKQWNFLADYNNSLLNYTEDGFFTDNNWASKQKVNLIHVYHHFGDIDWSLWNFVNKKVQNQ